jgi:hypothetical protein
VNALATTGDERRDSLRKAAGSWQISDNPPISEWVECFYKHFMAFLVIN